MKVLVENIPLQDTAVNSQQSKQNDICDSYCQKLILGALSVCFALLMTVRTVEEPHEV